VGKQGNYKSNGNMLMSTTIADTILHLDWVHKLHIFVRKKMFEKIFCFFFFFSLSKIHFPLLFLLQFLFFYFLQIYIPAFIQIPNNNNNAINYESLHSWWYSLGCKEVKQSVWLWPKTKQVDIFINNISTWTRLPTR
jgi:hypothetical protein